jgi:hypothetical protein
MHRRNILGIATTLALGFALVPSVAIAQQKTIQDQLPGAWTLLLTDSVKDDGTHVPQYGPNPVGALMFSGTGRYALVVTRSDLKPFASNDRNNGTAPENKAVVTGSLSHFGTYTTDEAGKSINFHMEGSSFPNVANTSSKRMVTAITDEVLTYNILGPVLLRGLPGGAQGIDHAELVWKKVK